MTQIQGPDMPEGFWPGAPDVAVEIVSPGDRRADVQRKVDEYLTGGCPLVWVVNPRERSITVHRRVLPPVRLSGDDTLDAGDVMPGFACAVRAIFE
jgi:Uma2 family endonuclease